MRENEYRGKTRDRGEWVYGYYLVVGVISYILPTGKTVQKENCTIMDDGYVHIQEICTQCGERLEFLGPLEQFTELLRY